MKKINFLIMGAAGLMFTACANEDLISNSGNPDGTANVTFTLSTPQIQSRAFSDGTTAKNLLFAVYEVGADGSTLTKLTGQDYVGTGEEINIKKQKTFKLLTDHTYQFVFWAQSNGTTPYTVTFGDSDATLEADYASVKANDENLDAFYGGVKLKITGDVQMDVPLYRPFAQINVGTNDFKEATELNYVPVQSTIKVEGYNKMSLLDDTIPEENTKSTITFAYNAIPSGETFPVNPYEYLAMTYVLVPADKETVTVSFDYKDESEGEGTHTRSLTNVPVQRNHRTNIYGQVLTSNADLFIEIKPDFDDPDHEPSALEMAAALGGSVILESDETYDGALTVKKDLVLDLNGNSVDFTGAGVNLDIYGAQTVYIKNGKITSSGATYPAVFVRGTQPVNVTFENTDISGEYAVYLYNEGNVTIKSGTYQTTDGENEAHAVYVEKGGKVTIEGGTFGTTGVQNPFLINILDAFRKTLSNPREAIEVKGGTFINFDPSDNATEGPNTNYVADGYTVITAQNGADTYYTVVPASSPVVEDKAALAEALNNVQDGDIIIINGKNVEIPVAMPENISFTLKGLGPQTSTINMPLALNTANGASISLSDLAITSSDNQYVRTSMAFQGAKEVNFDNVIINGEFHVAKGNQNASFTNCEFNLNNNNYLLWLESKGNVVVKDCKFKNSNAKAILICENSSNKAEMGNIEVTNCTFNADNTTDKAAIEAHSENYTAAGTLTINNCTFDKSKFEGGLWREIVNATGSDNGDKDSHTTFFTVYVDGSKVQ